MAGKLSFSIAINLLTENFKRGTNNVKSGLRAMQMQVLTFAAALGAGGLGLSNFVTRLIDVARETSRVSTALKNVSGSMSQYADNQKFVIDMAKKYGLEINALTGNFAKFTAASQVSGMSMMDQRKIFESVSRACTAFGMSADDSNGVFLALSQMMSKGKISSEELRLQMGERLPVALQAMAKAAGVSVAGLDKLMKQGKLMSKDVLPGFADALNEMTPNVDTDNLETSASRLKNAFTEFTKGTNIQSAYKGLIDWLTGAVQSAGENIKNIVLGVVAVISGIVINSAVKWWAAMGTSAAQLEAAALRSNTALIAATSNRIAAEIALENAKVAANNATGAAALAAKKKVIQAQNALASASAAEQVEIENVKAAELKVLEAKKIADAQKTAIALASATRKRIAAEIELEAAKMGVLTANNAQILGAQQRLATAQTALAKLTAKEIAAQEAAKAAAAQAASIKSATWWGRACATMKVAGAKLAASLKTMWNSFAPMIIISAIIAIGGHLYKVYQEAKRIKNIFSDYQKTLGNAGNTSEVTRMQTLVKIMNDRTKSQNEINTAQSELQKMLGKENLSQAELNKLVKTRIALLKEAAMAESAFSTVGEYTEKNAKLAGDAGLSTQQMDRLAKLSAIDGSSDRNSFYYNKAIRDELGKNGNLNKGISLSDVNKAVKEYIENNRVIDDATDRAGKYQESASKITTPTNDTDPDKKKTPLQKEQGSYNKQFEELGAELEIGKITQAEYNKALGDLNIKMYAQAKGTGDKEVLESEYYKIRKEAAEKAVQDQDKNSALVEFEKVQKEYNDKVKEHQVQQSKGLISQKELNENIASLSLEAAKSAAGIKGIADEADVFIATMQLNAKLLAAPVKIRPRDTTFDYKKSKTDIAGETLDKAKELADKYKEEAKAIGQTLSDEVANAMANVPSIEEALKLAEVQEDIKAFSKELDQMQWDGFKGAVSNIDGMVSAFQRLQDAFDPESEATEWERLMAVWNMMTSVVDGMMSIIKTIESITELTNKLTKAKETEAVIDTATTTTKVTNATTGAAASLGAAVIEKTAATGEVAANTAKGVSAAGSSAAKLPFPANIIAIGAAIAAAVALFAAIPKFATGGIVGGNSPSGDKILARLNSGEMVLNKGQQSRLGEAIDSARNSNSTRVVVGGSVEVRGDKMELAINNSRKKQGKKPL